MDQVIRDGHAFYWGTSEWSADMIVSAIYECRALGLIEPISEQPQYNIFVRDRFEAEYGRLFDHYK